MNMKVAIPAQSLDVDFNSARSSPFSSCSSTATRPSGFFFSAPTSPVRFTELYREFDELQTASSIAPYDSEATAVEDDFAFDFSADLERSSLSAEELFDGGKIKPLTPQLGLSNEDESEKSATVKIPNSPILSLPRGKKTIRSGLSSKQTKSGDERGGNRVSARSNLASSRGATRSVSPLRVSEYPWEEKDEDEKVQQQNSKRSQPVTAAKPSSYSWRSYRKWKLKDFFLFRSASEGRGSDKDPLKKYAGLSRKREEDIKNSSFRSISAESSSSVSSARRRGQQVSAHELHYTVNRAVSEDLKKKTFLPYKQGILGRLAFNPALHALANGFGSFTRS